MRTLAIAGTAEPGSSEVLQEVKGMWSQMDFVLRLFLAQWPWEIHEFSEHFK